MAIITITRGLHSGGEALAQAIATALKARCVSSEVLRETAKHFNVPEEKVSKVFEGTPGFWERMTESRRIYLAYIQAQLAEWVKDDNIVYHGNAGQELLREVPHVLKVRVIVPVERRTQLIMERFKYTHEQAAALVERIDDDRTRRTRYLYNTDWRDARRYDLTLNLERLPAGTAQEIILALVKKPEFTLDAAKRPAFEDFLLKSRVLAMIANSLVGRLSLINVAVTGGVVRLQGTLTSNEAMVEQLVEQIRRLEGVKGVENEIVVGLVYQEWNV
jgi:cytidylate kinase